VVRGLYDEGGKRERGRQIWHQSADGALYILKARHESALAVHFFDFAVIKKR
jgi:hypothetical protein